MAREPGASYDLSHLPTPVRSSCYNLEPGSVIPGHQLVFYAFNYGGTRAISYAAGLPWLVLYKAARLPGWRPKSRGLLRAVMRVRRI